MRLPEYLEQHLSPATRWFDIPGRVPLECGDTLDEVTVAYRTWGDRDTADGRNILVCHALTGSADVDAWWPGIIAADGAFDPRRDFVVCANILGGCYGSTGPVSPRPGSNEPYRASFPRVSVRDMVNVQRLLLDHLGVDRIELVTGPSLGGMQALEWAASYPERVASIVPIGVGGKHSAWCIGISEAQRAAIYADANWRDGYYDDDSPPEKGLAAARMMAVCSYRSWPSFHKRFGRERTDAGEYQAQSYLRHQGRKINGRFDAVSYVRLTQAMNDFDVSADRGNYLDVLESIEQPALVVSVDSDILYPQHEQELLARHLPNATHAVLHSDYGHDGFLVQTGELAKLIAAFRAEPKTEVAQRAA